MEIIHHLTHTFIDSIKILPLLFIVYFIIEYLEHKNNNVVHHMFMKTKKSGPIFGGLFGCIPQCGFSVIGSELYSKKNITKGTLIAIFISTSDEAIPILIAEPKRINVVMPIIGAKLVIAVITGFLVDVFTKEEKQEISCEHENHHHHHYHGNCENCGDGIVKSAIIHALRIFVYIFAVSFVLGLLVENIGGFLEFTGKYPWVAPFVSPAIGLIPNCAASVALTELYIKGAMSLGALIGGLCASAGVGLIVLLKLSKDKKDNLVIIGILYAVGVISSFLLQGII